MGSHSAGLCFARRRDLRIRAERNASLGREVKINLGSLSQQLRTANARTDATLPKIDFPMPNGKTMTFQVKESPLMENQAVDVKTYSAESADKQTQMRFTITPSGFSAIMHNADGYFIIEPIDTKTGTYRLYNMTGSLITTGFLVENKTIKNLSGLANGGYILTLTSLSKNLSTTLIKQ